MNDDGMLNAETQRKLPQGKILQPKLRFKGFTDPWQQRKLEEVTSSLSAGRSVNALDAYPGEEEVGVLKTSSVSDDSFNPHESKTVVKDERGLVQCPVEAGTIIVSRMNTPERVGSCGLVVKAQSNLYLPDRLWKLKLKSGTDSRFLHVLLTSNIYKSRIVRMATGTSGSMHNIPKDSFLDMRIVLPDIAEQTRIGEFFRALDDLIAAAKKKADLLKLKKRYYLQAIFNQRLRFKGFTEPWQQRKLGELFKERSERSNQGELISVTITNGVVPASSLERKDNSSEDKSNYKQVKTGDIAYNTMRMWQGASGVSPYSGILSPAYTVLIPSSEVSSSFFAQMFKLVRMLHLFQRYSQGLTSDTWNLKYPLLSEIRVTIPSLAEQERISEFLVLNDELTALVKKKAEDLQKIKSYYLQQLFV